MKAALAPGDKPKVRFFDVFIHNDSRYPLPLPSTINALYRPLNKCPNNLCRRVINVEMPVLDVDGNIVGKLFAEGVAGGA